MKWFTVSFHCGKETRTEYITVAQLDVIILGVKAYQQHTGKDYSITIDQLEYVKGKDNEKE